VLEPTPERPREVQPRGNQSAQLDRADDERDSDRPAGDDQVVEDLANRFATEKVISVTQLALAWLLAQGQDIVPTPGTRSPERLAENAAAADVELTDGDLARVAEILPDGAFGSRYPEAMMPKW
jgi:aryl-alcohol dehydrogenase-like predicted oxidoreductase